MAAKSLVPLGTYIGAGKIADKNADVHYTLRLLEKKLCWLDYKEESSKEKNTFHAEGAFVISTSGNKPIVKFTIGGLPGQPRVGDVYEFSAEESPAGPPVLKIDGIFLQPQSDCFSAEAETKVCGSCGLKIEGQVVSHGGVYYHKECFVCGKCSKPLCGTFTKQADGCKICQACVPAKYCEACKLKITGAIMSVGEKVYHPGCFKCEVCETPLEGGYFIKNDKVHCKECLDKSKTAKTTIRRTCRACKKPIEGCTMVEGEKGDVFHEECFKCSDCECKLEKDTYQYRDSKYRCTACNVKTPKEVDKSAPSCVICGKPCPIGDDHLRTMDGTILHWSCFKCSSCGTAQTVEQHGKTDPASMKALRSKVQQLKQGKFVCEVCTKGGGTNVTAKAEPGIRLGTYCGKQTGDGANGTDVCYAINFLEDNQCWLDCTTRTKISGSSWHSEGSFAEERVDGKVGKVVRVRYTVGKQSIGGGPEKGKIYLFDVDGEALTVEGIRCTFQDTVMGNDIEEYMKPAPPAPEPPKKAAPAEAFKPEPIPEGPPTKMMNGATGYTARKEIDKGKTIGEAPAEKKPAPAPASQSPPPDGCFTLAELQNVDLAKSKGVDPGRREEFLADGEFKNLFGVSKEEFAKQPKWKRDKQKKDHGLF